MRYYLEIKTHTLSFPGCRHRCVKEFEQPECCQGHWGPDCMAGKVVTCSAGEHKGHSKVSDGPNTVISSVSRRSCITMQRERTLLTGHSWQWNMHLSEIDKKPKFCFPLCNSQKGFGGTACEKCAEDNLFGPDCTSANPFLPVVCDCVHGVCNSGIAGNGSCTCLSGYKGLRCDEPIAECAALRCPANSRCAASGEDGTQLQCTCLPSFHGDSTRCEPINPCSRKVCDPNADCIYLGPNQHKCTCEEGYTGDGEICLPIDPCQAAHGSCPAQSSICIYDGPGKVSVTAQEEIMLYLQKEPMRVWKQLPRKSNAIPNFTISPAVDQEGVLLAPLKTGMTISHCECKEHYTNFVPGKGCSMMDSCETNNTCHKKAKCLTVAPGQIACTCQEGSVGNGFVCYGNIMERLQELNAEVGGQWQGKLTSSLLLMENTYEWQLSTLGPFTLLVPTNKGLKGTNVKDLLKNKQKAQYFVKLHIIAGQLNTSSLNNADVIYTLTGKSGEISKGEKDNQLRIRIQGGRGKGKILQGDIIASNGILHIIDKAMDNVEPTFDSSNEKTIICSSTLICKFTFIFKPKQKTGLGMDLQQDNQPYTVFVPSNKALSNMKAEVLDYLLSAEGSWKLLELVRYHIVSNTELEVASLVSIEHIRTMAKQFIHFNRSSTGQILVSGEKMEETDIVAKNGRIYILEGVLIPPTIVPILPHWCDETSQVTKGVCAGYLQHALAPCPQDVQPMGEGMLGKGLFEFIHSNYLPSISQCMDGLDGNGTCVCSEAFQGLSCQLCSDPGKYGPQCDKECLCIYGKCDNRIDSDGTCLPGSCRAGYTGSLCEQQIVPCEASLQLCHADADCQLSDGTVSCVCKPGYEGDGLSCSKVDPCAVLSPGGCNINAECVQTGPGEHRCVCQAGWTGDGRDCSAINNCLLPTTARCHENATCIYIGPAQVSPHIQRHLHFALPELGLPTLFSSPNPPLPHSRDVISTWCSLSKTATCQFVSSRGWECVCPEGYEGDGRTCYGNAADELSTLSEAAAFNQWVNTILRMNYFTLFILMQEAKINSVLSTTSNLTVLVPSLQAIENMDEDEKAFWMSKNNIPTLLKYHVLTGAYSFADFQNLSSSDMLPTSLQSKFLHLSKENGNLTLEGAHFVASDIASTNGVIHVIDKVYNILIRICSSAPQAQYSLANEIEAANTYTVFAPSNDAIENYLKDKKSATLDEGQIRYHVVLDEKLLKNNLHNGMHRETMLGFSYQVGFFLHNSQLYINDAPISYANVATDRGIIHGLGKVLEIQKNRCDTNSTVIIVREVQNLFTTIKLSPRNKRDCKSESVSPIFAQAGVKKYCVLTENHMRQYTIQIGCKPKCAKTIISRECCAGFFGPQCQACPGRAGSACSGNGVCLDGINGTGSCQCDPGFEGTACESCSQGRYGRSCDQGTERPQDTQELHRPLSVQTFPFYLLTLLSPRSRKGQWLAPISPTACTCVHGKCSSGVDGDGSCECDIGWRGVTCDTEIKDDACNASCHTSAKYTDNNEKQEASPAHWFNLCCCPCSAIDACESSNGGCSSKAECRRTTPGNRACVCSAGYTGDGIVCIEINPCLMNNGGCDRNAECTQTGPNQAVCNCLKGYSGDGKTCTYISLCSQNNGGCSEFAICNDTELTERTCTCKPNYIGDGFKCRGNIFQELLRNSNTSRFYFHLEALSIRDISGPGPFTLFVPHTDVLNSDPRVKDWVAKGVMAQVLRYHVVGCASLLYKDLTAITNITSLQGDLIHISYSQNSLVLNNKAEIVLSDAVGTNGVIHVINQILVPSQMQDFPLKKESLKMVAAKHGYILFNTLLEKNNLLGLINDPIHKPVTLFWPTDTAIRGLPQEQQDFLFKKSNTNKLVQYLKFHIVRDAAVLAYQLQSSTSLKTLQGSNLSVSCGDNGEIGALFLNDGQCKVVQRQLEFDGGIAYGINCLLTEPSLGGRCDSFLTMEFMVCAPSAIILTHFLFSLFQGHCASCFNNYKCPPGTKPKEGMQWCTYESYGLRRDGCRRNCSMVIHIAKCCKGYFGPDCQEPLFFSKLSACPGGPETPCNGHGSCDDGYTGTGECRCTGGFNGTSCELCLPGRYGFTCRPCECKNNGQCDEGYSGTGRCFCETGWTGRLCETKLALPPVCSPSCSANAICTENNTCQCKPLYDGDGITCTAAELCKQNNGGCHKAADCTQHGVKVFCSCQKGYKGDGFTCLPINPCADGFNGGCHEHAICIVTGPGRRKCECKNSFIGDGLNCSVMQQPLDRCLQDNGQCHPDADCADLHFQDTTVGVFHLQSPVGQYRMSYQQAKEACANESATIATYDQLLYAQKARYHLCSAGWLDGGRVGYPTAFSSPNCGSGHVGIVDYGRRVNLSETWDAFCYREKEVNCTCKPGYVGDGISCSGNLLQVLMSFPTLTNFLSDIMAYSNTSRKGREFLQYLTDLSVHATLFAPNDSGLKENETLSGRDIEYHLSNANIMFYEDLTNGTTLLTRLGKKLLITNTGGQEHQIPTADQSEIRYVDRSAIVEWDIIASNGIIHIISEPLKAPSEPAPLHASAGTGIFFGICLVTGIVALVGYSYLRFRKKNIGFQHFKSKDDTDTTSLDKSQPSNITNPSYESSSTLPSPEPAYDLFSVSVNFDLRLRHY
ncbi:Stabilin-2 [Lonchura striata]|uniref:Stabilin-2 n=1 Tax=Lonchura striata TaxID=40157 RepID=A0A218UXF2_9PASE|nr:Stabilin-2 [Lonchura striata domestica]